VFAFTSSSANFSDACAGDPVCSNFKFYFSVVDYICASESLFCYVRVSELVQMCTPNYVDVSVTLFVLNANTWIAMTDLKQMHETSTYEAFTPIYGCRLNGGGVSSERNNNCTLAQVIKISLSASFCVTFFLFCRRRNQAGCLNSLIV
jgi:hypothetical protein